MPTFEVEAMVRGYHVYEEIWDASIGEERFVFAADIEDEGTSFESAPCGSGRLVPG